MTCALLDLVVEDGLQRGLFALEHDGFALNLRPSLPLILPTAPSGQRLPLKMTRWLSFFERVAQRAHDFLALRPDDLGVLHVLLHRLAGAR